MKNQELDTDFAPPLCWISNDTFCCSMMQLCVLCMILHFNCYSMRSSMILLWDVIHMSQIESWENEISIYCLNGQYLNCTQCATFILHKLGVILCITDINKYKMKPFKTLLLPVLSLASASILCGSITNSGGCKSKDSLLSMSLDFVRTEGTHTLMDLDHPSV